MVIKPMHKQCVPDAHSPPFPRLGTRLCPWMLFCETMTCAHKSGYEICTGNYTLEDAATACRFHIVSPHSKTKYLRMVWE